MLVATTKASLVGLYPAKDRVPDLDREGDPVRDQDSDLRRSGTVVWLWVAAEVAVAVSYVHGASRAGPLFA
jgi:hypothetical protein